MNQSVIILGVSQYSFENDQKKMVSGTTVHYISTEAADEDQKKGYAPAKANLPVEAFEGMKKWQFPQVCEASILVDLANKRNPLKITAFKPVKALAI